MEEDVQFQHVIFWIFFLKNDAPVSKTKSPGGLFDGEEEDLFSSSKVLSQQLYI